MSLQSTFLSTLSLLFLVKEEEEVLVNVVVLLVLAISLCADYLIDTSLSSYGMYIKNGAALCNSFRVNGGVIINALQAV